MKLKTIASFLFAVFLISGCSEKPWVSKNYQEVKPKIDTATIIFPHIEYFEKIGDKKYLIPDSSIIVSGNVAKILKEMLNERKTLVNNAIIQNDSIVTKQWIPRYFLTSAVTYSNIVDILKDQKDGKNVFPLTYDVKLLTDRLNTRYFIFVTGKAFEASAGTKDYDVYQSRTFERLYGQTFAYTFDWYGLELHIFLVDKQTNKILWSNYNEGQNSKYNPFIKKDVTALCKDLLNQE